MKYLEPKYWKYEKKLEGLLYFAQVLNEVLFDYSIDTYKPNALNAHSITHEALNLLRKVRSKHIPDGNLKPVKEELLLLINKDLVVKSLLKEKLEHYLKLIKEANNIDDLYYSIYSIHTYLADKKYLEEVKNLLIETVIEGKRKRDIFFLTRVFVTELMNYGYSKSYLYNLTNQFFFQQKDNEIDNVNVISEFLDLFDFKEQKFDVFIQAPGIFWDFRKSLKGVDVKMSKTLKHTDKNVILKSFSKKKKPNDIYLIIKDVEALDHFSARRSGQNKLHFFINLFHLYHHRESLEFRNLCCVKRLDNNYTLILDEPLNSVKKQKDFKSTEAALMVEKLIKNLSFSRKNNSLGRFIKALELHKLALSANEEENQLLDLWAAIETLVQKKTESNESRIEQISNSLIPFLSYGYVKGLLLELFKDLSNWNKEKFYELLDSINDDPALRLNTFIELLVLEENDSKVDDLLGYLDLFPLLKNRVTLYNSWYKNPKEIKCFIERHSKKLTWQIRRIYRARNTLVHHGNKPQQLPILLENLSSYFHKIMDELEELMEHNKIRSIEHGILEMKIHYEENLNFINSQKSITKDNLKGIFLL
ncbi:hypothetical protein MWU59_13915 [Flavobacteriaceae bacterium F08102]|nr:hypothetical protein [Flavobacteriaceae bacterium F08102]